MAYPRQFGINVGIVRLFDPFEPRLQPHDGRVVTISTFNPEWGSVDYPWGRKSDPKNEQSR
jgi:hypothetical protein